MSKPAPNTKDGTRHVLENRGRRAVFEWHGNGWSTPGTGWQTKWSFMSALGWKYIGPEEQAND